MVVVKGGCGRKRGFDGKNRGVQLHIAAAVAAMVGVLEKEFTCVGGIAVIAVLPGF